MDWRKYEGKNRREWLDMEIGKDRPWVNEEEKSCVGFWWTDYGVDCNIMASWNALVFSVLKCFLEMV